MNGVQQRHARQNRQINERLKTLIAAYKTLGGSFTGDLAVDPRHLRDSRTRAAPRADAAMDALVGADAGTAEADSSADAPGAERRRRVRDAVEAALSDVILLGTEEQVRLAAEHGMTAFPFVWGTPEWISPRYGAEPVGSARQRREWIRFLHAAVFRYGPRGSIYD